MSISTEFNFKHLLDSILRSQHNLEKSYHRLSSLPYNDLSESAKWLVDNYYLIHPQIVDLIKSLNSGRFHPRVYELALNYLKKYRYIKSLTLKNFIDDFQKKKILTSSDIWSVPVMFRLTLINRLSRLVSVPDAKTLDYKQLVTNLRYLDSIDWKIFFESVSRLERLLALDPDGTYPRMTMESKEIYRHTIEQLARFSHLSEIEIARLLIDKAKKSVSAPENHIGYYLYPPQISEFKKEIGYHPPLKYAVADFLVMHPEVAYFSLSIFLLVLFIAGVLGFGISSLLAVFLFLFVLSRPALFLTNYLVAGMVMPSPPPQLNFSAGIPNQFSTVVVIPCLLGNPDGINDLLRNQEKRFLSNPYSNLYFALLTDFSDSSTEYCPEDGLLIDAAVTGIRQLNEKYLSSTGRAPFYLFHRRRLFNPKENKWMGWERKRGKLIEFNRFLKGAVDTSISVREGDLSLLKSVK
ncbi:MAG TPA: hypothetical protein VF828_00105, partial [Patescibacteria group bacterium]